ncbi:MAG: hypothetical protein EOS51_18155 [Mesorhizobium sp.]|uniref:hypothetical protein n=1 Tax=unclassified Mesorhizobium TaxID=325217 RepID=UPI000FEA5EC0|nr:MULTISPECIES: hypothetical protein [unclassified Mesorhizobium]RWC17053.1 MAG: hypothetical protein EOS51_18155 [Mesorhizobium sp.]TGU01269.1 hypothetical protein EN807_16445 [Mesorhizobium sp. M5C.F.Ca.ET.164.01.1.1]
MTAINVLKLADSVHVLSDGRAGDGFAHSLVPKAMPIPHLNAVVATRGPARLLGLMTLMLCTKSIAFDDLRGELGQLKWICEQQSEPWQIETLAAGFDVVVAGIGSKGPAAYLISNHGLHGLKPWHVFDIPYCLATPVVDQGLLEAVCWADDPLAEFPRLVDAQRAEPSVGGFAQLTSITAEGISTKLVRDYRDAVQVVLR